MRSAYNRFCIPRPRPEFVPIRYNPYFHISFYVHYPNTPLTMSEKVIISCPSCKRSLRMPADRNLRADCPHCGRQFYVAYGKLHTERNKTVEIKNEGAGYGTRYNRWRMRNGNPWYTAPIFIFGLLLATLIGVMVFKVAFLDEWNAFAHYQQERSLTSAKDYLRSFGSRANAAVVRFGRDSLLVDQARIAMETSCDRGGCDCTAYRHLQHTEMVSEWKDRAVFAYEECRFRTLATAPQIPLVNEFTGTYPTSVFIDSVRSIRTALLKDAIADYDRARGGGKASASQIFFRNTLDYLAANDDNTIRIVFRQEKDLKDWMDYGPEARQIVDQYTTMGNAMEGTAYPLPGQQPPASIKTFFTASTSSLEQRLTATVQTKLDTLFGVGMIQVKQHAGTTKPEGLVMEIDYRVSTLEEDAGPQGRFPSLYIWSSMRTNDFGLPSKLDPEQRRLLLELLSDAEPETRRQILAQYPDILTEEADNAARGPSDRQFKGYLLATNIDWELTMSYPGNVKPYKYEEVSRPMANINNVESQTGAYRKMMSTAFDNFSLAFLVRFGAE